MEQSCTSELIRKLQHSFMLLCSILLKCFTDCIHLCSTQLDEFNNRMLWSSFKEGDIVGVTGYPSKNDYSFSIS